MEPYIGQMLDNRYEILERIGVGGMAYVYKAKCHRLNRLVAVKILRSDLAQDEDFRRRFHAESQASAQLSSPNIVSIYDVSRSDGMEYIVMELIDGITLKQYMEKRGLLNWRESLHFILQIMRGLSNAHSRGIVHRDIKPQNIMVLRDGSVKVADFGIAVLENSAQTLTQQALGSVHYISPEQARGDRTDARSDIYSAGVVLYEMLTGRLPFEGESAVSVAIQHLSSTPPDPRSINPDIPEQLELICMKAMAPDLNRRYASAEEMIRDLEAFRRDPGIRLDFQLSDLRPVVTDEPTRSLRTAGGSATPRYPSAEPKEEPARHLPQILLACAAGIAAVVLAVLLFRSIFSSFTGAETPNETHMVQPLLGLTVERARELDGIKGIFQVIEAGEQPSDDYPRGTIARQEPEANHYRKGNNLVIRVWVSSGEDTGEMPDVAGQTLSEAEKVTLKELIRQYGLTVQAPETDMRFSETVPSGRIISSLPAKGETLRKGDTIFLTLSKGPQPPQTWTLPRFVDLSYDIVKKQLDTLKLDGDFDFVYNEKPFGTILSQDPPDNSKVTDGTKVRFTVSRGPEPPAPDKTMEVLIPLPDDRESAYMELWRDGERIWSGRVDCTEGQYSLKLTGTGETVLEVYLDREEFFNGTIVIDEEYSPMTLEKQEKPEEEGTDETEGTESRIGTILGILTGAVTPEATATPSPEAAEESDSAETVNWIGTDIIDE